MAMIRIYGSKGSMVAKPFEVNSVDIIPEAIAEEKEIINSPASDTEQTE